MSTHSTIIIIIISYSAASSSTTGLRDVRRRDRLAEAGTRASLSPIQFINKLHGARNESRSRRARASRTKQPAITHKHTHKKRCIDAKRQTGRRGGRSVGRSVQVRAVISVAPIARIRVVAVSSLERVFIGCVLNLLHVGWPRQTTGQTRCRRALL